MLKKGDKVVMHTCGEAEHYNGKIWTCKNDEYVSFEGQGIYEQKLVFLEGFSGSFHTKYLQLVDLSEQQQVIEHLNNVNSKMDQCLIRNGKEIIKRENERAELQGGIDDYKNVIENIQRAIHTEHCTMNHQENTEYEKGKIDGLIKASNIIASAVQSL
ncbi:hypothetical protein [Bacillus sp. JJ722]|uniref:hypothetical protein n=1 Tax=Bacillus sp. JJ722 TaxID=3122973 RepID=UPI002FFE62F4